MRLWENEPPSDKKPESVREYEVVGYGTLIHLDCRSWIYTIAKFNRRGSDR